jgi:xylan 1,4-beta-xylosidase
MPKRRANRTRRFIFLTVILAAGAAALFLAERNKFYVKRFIKEHEFLYVPAQKLAVIKSSILKNVSSEKNDRVLETYENYHGPWQLRFDLSDPGQPFQRFWGNLGYESFVSILNSRNRELFKLMQEANQRTKGAFRFIRAHNIFSNGQPPWGEGLDVYHEDAAGHPRYNWELLDQVFDEIQRFGFKPIVELGFMPDALASIPERRQKWSQANVSPPKDYQKWYDLVYAAVAHLVARYGRQEVASWYFEVWNEPDLGYLFWIEDPKNKPWGDLNEYCKLYDYTAAAVKAALPDARVGGPATAGLGIERLLEHTTLEKNFVTGEIGSPIDFVSSHAYGMVYPLHKRKKNMVDGIELKIARARAHDHEKVRAAMESLPFLLTETGPSTKNNAYYNTRYVAAWWAKMADAAFYLGEKFGKAYQPDEIVSWSTEQLLKGFGGNWGVAVHFKSDDGFQIVKRPLFNIFEALGHLSDNYVKLSSGSEFRAPVHAFAARAGNRSVEIMLYHFDEWDYENSRADSHDVFVSLENLPFSDFELRCYLIDETHSNGFTAWKELGKPEKLTREQTRILDNRDDLELSEPPARIQTPDFKIEKKFRLQSNSVMLLVLTKQ